MRKKKRHNGSLGAISTRENHYCSEVKRSTKRPAQKLRERKGLKQTMPVKDKELMEVLTDYTGHL